MQALFRRSYSQTAILTLERELMIRATCYKVHLVSQAEKKKIKKKFKKQFPDNLSLDQVKMRMLHFGQFSTILGSILESLSELTLITLFKEINEKEKLSQLKTKEEVMSYTLKAILKHQLLLNNPQTKSKSQDPSPGQKK